MRIYHLVESESLWALSQRGSVNLPQVRDLQDKLRAAGFDPGPSDGWYGQRTANAVRAYQQANNLAVDGDAGPQTLGSLGMAGAQQTPAQPTPPAETPPAPAPRQPAREPEPTPAPAPTRREPEPEPAPTTRREPDQSTQNIQYIEVGNATNDRELRRAVNQIGEQSRLNFRFKNFMDSRRFEGGGAILDVEIEAFESSDNTRRIAREVINTLQEYLRGSANLAISVSTPGGTTLANGRLYLDPMPTRNESINRLSKLAGL